MQNILKQDGMKKFLFFDKNIYGFEASDNFCSISTFR